MQANTVFATLIHVLLIYHWHPLQVTAAGCLERAVGNVHKHGFSTLRSGVNRPRRTKWECILVDHPQQVKHTALLLPTQNGGALTQLL